MIIDWGTCPTEYYCLDYLRSIIGGLANVGTADIRTITVAAEDRTISVILENRFITVPNEDNTITVRRII